MRFAGRVSAANYIAAGRAAADQSSDMQAIARNYAPDYQALSENAINEEAKNYKTGQDVYSEVAQAGINAQAKVALANEKVKVAEARDEGRRGAARGAMISAAGGFIGSALEKQPASLSKPYEATDTTAMQNLLDKYKERAVSARSKYDAIMSEEAPKPSAAGTVSDDGSPSDRSTPVQADGDLSMQYMNKLTGAGMSPEQAAATVGHLRVETGGFKYMEELAPNVHGTKGYGHLQWTDPTPGQGRRTDFMNYAKAKGLDPRSFEANSDFLVHELTTNFNQSWTGGGSFNQLLQQPTLEGASAYLQSNFIRPGIPHTDRRLAEARSVLSQWNSLQS